MRLVVDQDPDDIFRKLVAHAKTHGFRDLEIEKLGGFHLSRTRLDHPIGQAAARAVREGFGKEPLLQPSMGGSDPDYYFTRVLGIPRINVPYAPHDENNHAPNENIKVEGLFGGIRTTAAFLFEAAKPEGIGSAERKKESVAFPGTINPPSKASDGGSC